MCTKELFQVKCLPDSTTIRLGKLKLVFFKNINERWSGSIPKSKVLIFPNDFLKSTVQWKLKQSRTGS